MTQECESRPGWGTQAATSVSHDAASVPDVADILAEVDRNADGWWHSCALAGLEHLAATGRPFTAYDLADLGVPDPDVPARWGALMRAAAMAGLIRPVAVVGSSRPTVHGSLVRQWVGGEAA